jgi:C4-dicarboxylate transporter DctQ subunit
MKPAYDDAPSADAPRLSRAHLLLARVETYFDLVAAVFIFGLMLLGVAQVLGRQLFNKPVTGYIDLVELSIATFAFLGIAYCERVGGHVRMELFLNMAKGRLHFAMEIFGTLIGLFIIGVLTWFSFEHFLRAYELGDTTIDAELPVWPSKLVVPVSLGLLWLRLLVQLVGFGRLWLDPQATPVAVPHTLTAEEIAAKEIEESAQGS